jgi:RimJ/RimL family protein N-acetyltransferase
VAHPYWPFFDLRIRTPRFELRPPTDDDLVELAALAAKGVHDPDKMPFLQPWTRAPSPQLERNALQWGWRSRAELTPERWRVAFAVVEDGTTVGTQDVGATDFAIRRSVNTGSWVGRAYQGRGVGKEMRAAVLHFAFAGLGAWMAHTEAFEDNPASLAVTRALGYVEDGEQLFAVEGRAQRELRFRMPRDVWEQRRRDDIVIEGLEPCLELLGAG